MVPIENLPGVKEDDNPQKKRAGVVSRCEICTHPYMSEKEKAIRRKYSYKAQFLGCDHGCNYWVHGICAKIPIEKDQNVKDIPFTCPKHTTNNAEPTGGDKEGVIVQESEEVPEEVQKQLRRSSRKRKSVLPPE